MPDFSVHYSHVIILTVANFFLSWFWYSRGAFGRPWLRALKRDPDRAMKDMSAEERKRMPFLMFGGLLSSFLRVFILAAAVAATNAHSLPSGALIGLLAWMGFTLTVSLDTLWEGRPGVVLLINNGLFVLTYTVFGALLAVWN